MKILKNLKSLNLSPLPEGKKVYFASDFHLGSPNHEKSRERETQIIQWLEQIEDSAHAIFLVGDIFDFWFEYKHVVPKGFIRFLGKIAQLKDKGIDIHFFVGNHDIWMFDYFTKELGIPVYKENIALTINETRIFLGHGDGFGPGDYAYKFIKKVFHNRFLQFLFRWVHPDLGIGFATAWSKHSRGNHYQKEETHLGEKEWLLQFAKSIEKQEHFDYYIFGHRHHDMALPVSAHATYLNLGEWFATNSYAVFDGEQAQLAYFHGAQ